LAASIVAAASFYRSTPSIATVPSKPPTVTAAGDCRCTRTRSASVSFRDGAHAAWAPPLSAAAAEAVPPAAGEAGGCNRGFSFECFSLRINGDEPLFPGVGDDDDDDDGGGKGGGDEDDDDNAVGGGRGVGADDDRAHQCCARKPPS
jgi:hypothetical protein